MNSADTPARRSRSRCPWFDVAAMAILAATVAGWCGRWHWLLDLTSHFRWYWLVLALAGLVAGLVWRRPTAISCLAFAAVANGREMLPYWLPAARPAAVAAAASAAPVFVITINVHRHNDAPAAAIAYLRDRCPDIVAVLEVDDAWAAALEGLDDILPHRVVHPRADNFGIAVVSRWPLTDVEVVALCETGFPSILATVGREGRPFRFIATHPYPPFDGRSTRLLVEQLDRVAAAAATSPLPCVVAGDFNATPWCRAFRRLVSASGLVDTALGRGVQTTWNARYPAPRIPIDHVLVPPTAIVLRRQVGPDVGSDHFPVEAEFVLP